MDQLLASGVVQLLIVHFAVTCAAISNGTAGTPSAAGASSPTSAVAACVDVGSSATSTYIGARG